MGRSIDRYLPAGDDARTWRRFLNHSQMLFHEHSLNEQREQAGLMSINGLWLEGEMHPTAPTLLRYSMTDLMENMQEVLTASDEIIIAIDDWINPTHQGDLEAWIEAWQRFPAFAKAMQQMQHKLADARPNAGQGSQRKETSLIWNFFGEAAQYSLQTQRADRWRFWRNSLV
jgi:hypothetical protein